MRSIAGVALWRWVALLAGVVVLTVAVLGPGGTSPAVATVNGQAITLSSYRGWLTVAAVSAHAADSAVPPFAPDAPRYSRCVAFLDRAAAKSHAHAPTVASARGDCRQLRVALAEEVMRFLLSGRWFLDEGAREHVAVGAATLRGALHSSFPKTAGLTAFLSSNGMSRDELLFEARTSLVAQRLSVRHSGPIPSISAAQIAAYYAANRSAIGTATLQQATPAIRQALIAQAQAPKFAAWLTTVRRRLQPRTRCARGFRVAGYCARGVLT
jgi:hypothetical protein